MKYATVDEFTVTVEANEIEGLAAYFPPASDGDGGFFAGEEWTDYVRDLHEEYMREGRFSGSLREFQRYILEGAWVHEKTINRFLDGWNE